MTYKLEPWIEKINSIITVILADGTRIRYINGNVAVADVFDRHYVVKSMVAISGEILIRLEEAEVPATGWIGEAQHGFF